MSTTLGEVMIVEPEIFVSKEQLQRQMGDVKRPERFTTSIDRVLSEASELWTPKVCWVRYAIQADSEAGMAEIYGCDGFVLRTLEIGPRTDLLEGAKECFVGVGTVGPELSDRIQALESEGNVIDAYLMDIVGVLALNATHKEFRDAVESYSSGKGWGVGPILQPGSLDGWQIDGQRDLLGLLPIEKIGVTLNQYLMMVPQKTNSTLVGVGPDYGKANAQCLCEDCGRYDCPWRRASDYR